MKVTASSPGPVVKIEMGYVEAIDLMKEWESTALLLQDNMPTTNKLHRFLKDVL